MGWRAWVWFGRAVTPRHFAWQAWHNVTSTFVSRGRRGTNSHLPSFRVAGVALMAWGGALGCGLGARWRRAILRGRRGRTLHPPSFHVAGVAQIRIYLRFAWQAWHSWHGVARLGVVWARGDAAPFCVAGVAQPYIHLRFTWQVWHKLTSTSLSRGRRGTNSHLPSFGVAGVAQTRIYLRFAWQAWHSWHGVARLGVVWARGDAAPFCVAGVAQTRIYLAFHVAGVAQTRHPPCVSRGRRGTNSHLPSFRVAGVAQTRIYLSFRVAARWRTHGMGWRAWVCVWAQRWHPRFILRGRRGTTLHPPCVSRGRRGTNSHLPTFRLAGVALMAWVGALGCGLGARWRRAILRGRRRTTLHPPSFHVAGVAQTRIYLRLAWQAWHKLASTFVWRGRRGNHGMGWRAWVWFGRAVTPRHFAWQAWHNVTSTFVSRGRRGTNSHLPSFRVAGVALNCMGWRAWVWFGRAVTPRHFAWQAWHNLTSTFVSRGRCGTNWHPPCFRVAGVALMAWGGALGCGLGARWRRAILRGRRGRTLHPPSFHVAGVAQTDIHLAFAWQAWQSWHGVARLGAVWARGDAAPFSRGRRGTTSHPPSFHVAGVALMALGGVLGLAWAPVTPRHFAWQAWHKLTPTAVSVAGVAQTHTYCRFTWQAWHKLTSTVVLCGRRGTNSHPPSFCVAGVALGDIHLDYVQGRFAWQAPHSWHLVTYTLISRGTRRGTISRPWRQQLIMTIYQVSLPATGHAERVRKICGFARKSAEHYFGQRKYGEHTIALIAEPGGTRRKRSNLLTSNLLTNNLPYIPTYMTYIHTYLPTYIHTFIPTILPSRSFTTSVVFPSFPVPAKTIEAHFRKKLTCGVIRSFNCVFTRG